MKAVLKFHQDSAHQVRFFLTYFMILKLSHNILLQAHAMICTICGKIVRDMRKHKLVHSGEKPFQCDRCSYRCSRSGTLKRHMATHLNAGDPPRPNVEVDANQQPQQQLQEADQQLLQPQQQQPQVQIQAQHATMQTIQIDQQQAIPIHIQTHNDPTASHQEPKYIELNPATLDYASPPPAVTSAVAEFRAEFKFP